MVNTSDTLANFNKTYGTSYTEDQIIVLNPGYGFSNTGGRSLAIATDTDEIISKAVYNDADGYNSTDVSDSKDHTGVVYKAAEDGSATMVKLASKQAPSPGTLIPDQVPAQRMELPADFIKPVLSHMIPAGSTLPKALELSVKVSDDQKVEDVSLHYKTDKMSDYAASSMASVGDSVYKTVVPEAALTGASRLQYYILASDGRNNADSRDKEGKDYEIKVVSPFIRWKAGC